MCTVVASDGYDPDGIMFLIRFTGDINLAVATLKHFDDVKDKIQQYDDNTLFTTNAIDILKFTTQHCKLFPNRCISYYYIEL